MGNSDAMFKNYLSTAVYQAGEIIVRMLRDGIKVVVKTDQPGGSHHSIGTDADDASEAFLLDCLRKRYPEALYLAEEHSIGPDHITDDNLKRVKSANRVFVVDPVDGTASFFRGMYDFSVVLNELRKGEHFRGSIFAPMVRGGFLAQGDRENGVFVWDGDHPVRRSTIIDRPIDQSMVLMGVDVWKRPQFLPFAHHTAKTVQSCFTAGSCGLGVAMVAAGLADAIVQPQQWFWDAASAAMVEYAGGVVQYYHYRGGEIIALDKPDLPAYNRSNRTNLGGLGFIAGAPDLVAWLFEELKANWQRQV